MNKYKAIIVVLLFQMLVSIAGFYIYVLISGKSNIQLAAFIFLFILILIVGLFAFIFIFFNRRQELQLEKSFSFYNEKVISEKGVGLIIYSDNGSII
jgi:uncharacterized membrane protein